MNLTYIHTEMQTFVITKMENDLQFKMTHNKYMQKRKN